MMKRNILVSAVLSALIVISSPAKAQLVVSDPGNLANSKVQHALQLSEMAKQLAEMKRHYEQLKQQHEAITGTYGRGNFEQAITQQAVEIVPGSWQDVVRRQASGEYGQAMSAVEEKIKTLDDAAFASPEGQAATSYRMSTDAVRSTLATGDVLYAQVNRHMDNLARLQAQVDATTNLKDAQDLGNRIQIENGLLQGSLARLAVVNNNLSANQLNSANQGRSMLRRANKQAPAATTTRSSGGY